jgi:hypothetical protein
VPSNVETDGIWREERLASLLLRLLGVYFLAWAIISGVEEAVRLFFAFSVSKIGLDELLPTQWPLLAYLGAEFTVGAYLLIGGQWVFEKVLIPVVPGPRESEDTDEDTEMPDDQTGTNDSPSMNTE